VLGQRIGQILGIEVGHLDHPGPVGAGLQRDDGRQQGQHEQIGQHEDTPQGHLGFADGHRTTLPGSF
jgi:hypothetical protein